MEPLSREEFGCLIDRYPLIFRVEPKDVGSLTGSVGLQYEFYHFVWSHGDVFEEAVRDAVDELRGTGAVLEAAILGGIAHMIELYLGRPFAEDHLPMIVASLYMVQRPEMEGDLGEAIA